MAFWAMARIHVCINVYMCVQPTNTLCFSRGAQHLLFKSHALPASLAQDTIPGTASDGFRLNSIISSSAPNITTPYLINSNQKKAKS